MGRINSGVSNGFEGRVGNVVGYFSEGKYFLRIHRKTIKSSKSVSAMTVRARFLKGQEFIKCAPVLFRFGYSTIEEPSTWYSKALGSLLRDAIQGSFPDLCFEPSKITFSTGEGIPLLNPRVVSDNWVLTLNWDAPNELLHNTTRDRIIFIACNFETKNIWFIELAEQRIDQCAEITLPASIGKGTIHLYAFTFSLIINSYSDRGFISPTTYCGSVLLA